MLRCSVDNIAMQTDDSYVNVVVNIIIIINVTIIINIVIINVTIMIINEINTIVVSALITYTKHITLNDHGSQIA
jgi:hypothetical protein